MPSSNNDASAALLAQLQLITVQLASLNLVLAQMVSAMQNKEVKVTGQIKSV